MALENITAEELKEVEGKIKVGGGGNEVLGTRCVRVWVCVGGGRRAGWAKCSQYCVADAAPVPCAGFLSIVCGGGARWDQDGGR